MVGTRIRVLSLIKNKYFCSELIVNCFIHTGFISQSAAIMYLPKVYSPGDLSRDPTFGIFYGYLTTEDINTIPIEDVFYYIDNYEDIHIN